eukprot:3555216-Amphidinium_carterae.1
MGEVCQGNLAGSAQKQSMRRSEAMPLFGQRWLSLTPDQTAQCELEAWSELWQIVVLMFMLVCPGRPITILGEYPVVKGLLMNLVP